MAKQGLRGIEAALTIPKDKKPSTQKEEFTDYDPWGDDQDEMFPNKPYTWEDVYDAARNEVWRMVLKKNKEEEILDGGCDMTHIALYHKDTNKELAYWIVGRIGDMPAIRSKNGKKIIALANFDKKNSK